MSTDNNTVDILYPPTTAVETDEAEQSATTGASDESATEESTTDEHGYELPTEKQTGNPHELPENKGITDDLYGAESKVEISSETDLSIIASSEDEQAMLSQNLSFMASTCGALQLDVESLVTVCNQHVITNAQHSPDEVMSALYEQHGKDLSVKLSDAQQLIASYPQLSAWLDSSQAGNNPQIINQIMKIAESPRAQKRLQTILSRSKKS